MGDNWLSYSRPCDKENQQVLQKLANEFLVKFMYLVKWTENGPGKVLTMDTKLHIIVRPWEGAQVVPTVLKPSHFFLKHTLFLI